jgi:hypothetical protein
MKQVEHKMYQHNKRVQKVYTSRLKQQRSTTTRLQPTTQLQRPNNKGQKQGNCCTNTTRHPASTNTTAGRLQQEKTEQQGSSRVPADPPHQ